MVLPRRTGPPLETETYARLEDLCGRAHSASGSPAVRLTQVRRELGRLREEQGRAQQVAETRLAGLEEQISRLARELEKALDRVETQNNSLRHAQDYSYQIEAELAEQQEQTRLLQREVGVLREQNLRLVEEQTQAVPGVSTQDTSVLAVPARQPEQTTRAVTYKGKVHLIRGAQDPFAALPGTRRADPPGAQNPFACSAGPPHQDPICQAPSPTPEPPRPFEPPANDEKPTGGRSFFCVALMTYVSLVLWLTFLVALAADPGPSIFMMFIAAAVTLLGPYFGLGVLMGLLKLDESRLGRLSQVLFAAQIVTFIAWWTMPMGPVFGAVGVDTVADWLVTTTLL
ncbi:hypothetical protein [Streptomyces laculatispora]|uniref:hypothetical protein n=1 Tax=Streptomyces laculatispora TaxID=887464 RepID=UPI001F5E832A|nr:hypothetical protein [Streptomyces laculatispora]